MLWYKWQVMSCNDDYRVHVACSCAYICIGKSRRSQLCSSLSTCLSQMSITSVEVLGAGLDWGAWFMFIVHPWMFWREIPGMAGQLGCRFKVFVVFLLNVALCSVYAYICCFGAERTADAAWCCCLFDLSYGRNPSSDRCPVLSCMIFSGTPLWYIYVALVACKLWFVFFPSFPAVLHIFLTFSLSVCLPTGSAGYHGANGSN